MNEERPAPAGQLEQRARVGPAWRPAEHEIDCLGFALEEGNGDLTGRERLTDMAHQEIDNRSPSQSAGYLLPEGSQAPNQVEVRAGAVRVRLKLR